MSRSKIYFDFEYRDNSKQDQLVLFQWKPQGEPPQCIDLRDGINRDKVAEVVEKYKDRVWFAYNADAELRCMNTLGIDFREIDLVDVMIEWNMIRLTHPLFYEKRAGLAAAIKKLKIDHSHQGEEKDRIRVEIILNNTTYSEDQWKEIVDYGLGDVEILPEIIKAIYIIHQASETGYSIDQAINRGQFIKATTHFSIQSKGFPVNQRMVRSIYDNRDQIKNSLAEHVNQTYGTLYRWNKQRGQYSFYVEGFEQLIKRMGLSSMWKRTKSGRASREKDYISSMCKQVPDLLELHRAIVTSNALNSTDLTQLMSGGYVKMTTGYRPLNQVTGRTSPKPAEGFILNLPPWLRTIIHPKTDCIFLGADWSQQEIAVAAVLSGDDQLLEAYNSGDIYSYLAKMSQSITEEQYQSIQMWKEMKKGDPRKVREGRFKNIDDLLQIRQNYKSVQLGIGYGRSEVGLADVLWAEALERDKDALLSDSEAIASEIYQWHKDTFHVYWDWIEQQIADAEDRGYIKSIDGWTYFMSFSTRRNQLLNFPMQSTGAAIMRKAVVLLYSQRPDIDLVCTLHDALYINSDVDNQQDDVKALIDCMDQAVSDVIGGRVRIRNDLSRYTNSSPYKDARGDKILAIVTEALGQMGVKLK